MENESFSINSGAGGKPELIPHGTLHFAQVRFREMKRSQRTGGRYASIQLVLIDGEHEGRSVFTLVMDPFDPLNKDEAKRREGKVDGAKMGLVSLTRMLEVAGIFTHADPNSYRKFDGKGFDEIMRALDLQKVAIRIKIAKGTEGYEDKNEVAEFLSPYQESGGYKDFVRLVGGADNIKQARGAALGGATFGAPQQQPRPQVQAPGNKPSWLNDGGNKPF